MICVEGDMPAIISKEVFQQIQVKTDANKQKYVTYRCGNRDRTKECKNPELRLEYIENYVLAQFQEKVFSKDAILLLAKQLSDYQKSKGSNVKGAREWLSRGLEGVERQITNIVNAIASGVGNETLLGS